MKNKIKLFTVALLTCIFIFGSKVYAFTNSDYYNNQNINIGIKSMEKDQLNITFNGDYTLNGVTFKSGTSYLIKASGSQISFNGSTYDTIKFIPKISTNTIRITSIYSRYYLGTMTFKIDSTGKKVMPINTIYIEDYLKGVVGYEMSDSFPMEALKAQAVAARNYALTNIGKHSGYDLCDTTCCQVYGGNNTSLKRVIDAVDATRGTVLLSGTSIVAAYYSASDGGFTEASENVWWGAVNYLKAKKDSFDGYDANYLWKETYTNDDINNLYILKSPLNGTFVKIDLDTITNYPSGRIKNISLIFKNLLGIEYKVSYGKEAARTFLGFKSSLYKVSYNTITKNYSFDGKGWGHGVGMSQIGAKNRALAGQSFGTILKFYYDGSTLINTLPKISNISVDTNKIYTFDNPSFSVLSTGGSNEGLTYKYVIEYNKATVYDSGFVGSPKIQYKPTKSGSYNLRVYVKDKASILPFEDSIIYNFIVQADVAPTGFTATPGYNSILLKWTKSPVTANSGYEVYRSTSSTGSYTLMSTNAATSYNNTGLTINSTYYYKVRAYRMAGTVKVYSGFSTIISSKPINIKRLAGANRIETSIAIAKEQYKDEAPEAVVLATANDFADALTGSGLAYKTNAPLLLVNKTVSGSKNILDYITMNLSKSKKIYILGGTGAVSKEISDYLITKGYEIIRLGGNNRYETNKEIVKHLNPPKGTSMVIATGNDFADALSISSIADIKGYPIFLNSKKSLLDSVSNYITNIQPTTVYLIGGEGVLSDNIKTQIKLINSNTTIVRLGGNNRYETSMKIIEYFKLSTNTIAVATGLDFPDALSGSVLAARKDYSVLLVNNKDITKQKELLKKQGITNIIVFGGEGVVSNNIAASLIQK